MASYNQAVAWLKALPPAPGALTAGLRASLGRAQLLALKTAVKKTRSPSRHCLSFPWELLLVVLLPFASARAVLQLCYGHACTWPCTPLITVPAPGPQADCPLHPRTCLVTVTSPGDPWRPALPCSLPQPFPAWLAWAWWVCSQSGMAQPLQPGGTAMPGPQPMAPAVPQQSSSAEVWSVSSGNIRIRRPHH